MSSVLVLFAYILFTIGAHANLQCINNEGKPVEWWFAIKSNHGTKYSYYDGSSKGTKLTPQTKQTLSAGNNSCVERTLNQVYNNKDSINYVGYNDENPNGTTSFTLGHSKGVLAFDDTDNFAGLLIDALCPIIVSTHCVLSVHRNDTKLHYK